MKAEMMTNDTCPIFIISSQRSGSTLLRYILDTHPEICSPPELHLGDLCRWLLFTVKGLAMGQVATAQSWEEREVLALVEVKRIISDWMNTYARSRGKRLWCEKTPKNVYLLDDLKDVFTDSKFICLYRNCMDVVHSSLESSKDISLDNAQIVDTEGRSRLSQHIDRWGQETTRMMIFERKNPDNCIRVRYEDLVCDPVKTLSSVFSFIGVPWDSTLLDSVFTTYHHEGLGDQKVKFTGGIHTKSIGKGSAISIQGIPDECRKNMNTLLELLGYPLVETDSGQPISPYIEAFIRENSEVNNTSVVDLNEIFEKIIPERLRMGAQRFHEVKAICRLVVTGGDAGTRILNVQISNGRIRITKGKADCTITVTQDDLIDIINGKRNPAIVIRQSRANVTGDYNLATVMGQLLVGARYGLAK
jgi:protein-tyrosine sulfotransferase